MDDYISMTTLSTTGTEKAFVCLHKHSDVSRVVYGYLYAKNAAVSDPSFTQAYERYGQDEYWFVPTSVYNEAMDYVLERFPELSGNTFVPGDHYLRSEELP